MLRRIYKKWSSWWNGAVITDICGLKLNEICHHQMRFMGSSTSKIRLRQGLAAPSPRTPLPLSALRVSHFGPLGLKLSPQTQKPNFAHGRWEICQTNQNTAATALLCDPIWEVTLRSCVIWYIPLTARQYLHLQYVVSEYELQNGNVFRMRETVKMWRSDFTPTGSFHTLAPETGNACLPTAVRHRTNGNFIWLKIFAENTAAGSMSYLTFIGSCCCHHRCR